MHQLKVSTNVSHFIKVLSLTFTSYLLFYAQLAYAQTPNSNVPDAATMLQNFSQQIPQFMQLVTATAYVMGMFFIYRGIISLKEYGEARTQMSSQHDLKGPIVLMGVGTFLLYLPSSVQAGFATFWSDPNPYGYVTESADQWTSMYQDCFMVIQLIGTISFIRGLVILTQLSGQGAQPGTFGRGLAHIVAGILCINLYDFLNAVNATLGISGIIPTSSS